MAKGFPGPESGCGASASGFRENDLSSHPAPFFVAAPRKGMGSVPAGSEKAGLGFRGLISFSFFRILRRVKREG